MFEGVRQQTLARAHAEYGHEDAFSRQSTQRRRWPPDSIVVAPNVNPALARHPTFQRSVKQLREWGVRVLYERSTPPPVWMASWERILEALPL